MTQYETEMTDQVETENLEVSSARDLLKNETIEVKRGPIVHPSAKAPLCKGCSQLDLLFFDPDCPGCLSVLKDPDTSVPEIFAIIRQWMPQTQRKINVLAEEILKRGCHIDDRDGLTDMTLLHYACKSGANGVGDPAISTQTVAWLLEKGADIYVRSRWTDMAAIHYAAYFDVAPVLELLLKTTETCTASVLQDGCREFNGGAALHIAATNLCLDVAKLLVRHGASLTAKDGTGKIPQECIPEVEMNESLPDLGNVVTTLYDLLTPNHQHQQQQNCSSPQHNKNYPPADYSNVSGKAILKAAGIQIGDLVCLADFKMGYLRYCGTTHFASGVWAGVELHEQIGKNDGSVKGVRYFSCPRGYGIFIPINKVSRCDVSGTNSLPRHLESTQCTSTPSPRAINHPKVNISHVTPKVETGLWSLKRQTSAGSSENHEVICIGDRVLVTGRRKGTVRFAGETSFASGWWYGVELDKPLGKNDGTVQGKSYFSCKANHGLFASPYRITKMSKTQDEEEDSEHGGSSGDLTNTGSMSQSSNDADFPQSPIGFHSPASTRKTNRSLHQHSLRPSSEGTGGGNHSPSSSHASSSSGPNSNNPNCWLTVGVNVFVNNEIGIVRYIGGVDFTEGTWLGVELRTPCGKNDGSVNGHRYFICKPNHGILVKPNRVTIRGINGAKLLPPNDA